MRGRHEGRSYQCSRGPDPDARVRFRDYHAFATIKAFFTRMRPEKPETAANRLRVKSYRNSFKRIATSTTISITSLIGTSIEKAARTNFSLSMQHLSSEITLATSVQYTRWPLCFRLLTRRPVKSPEPVIVTCSTALALPVYMGVD